MGRFEQIALQTWWLRFGLLALAMGVASDLQGGTQSIDPKPAADSPSKPEKPLAPDIVADLADRVEDGKAIPAWRDSDPPEEGKAYVHALIQADQTSLEAFANSARRDLTYAHLFEEPHKYRGQVVHFEGRLVRIRRFDPPKFAQEGYDIPNLYEGWVFDQLEGANPRCIIFTKLPPGVSVKESLAIQCAFDGYFFKKYRYKAGDGLRDAPLFIGHSFGIRKAPAESEGGRAAFSQGLLFTIMGVFAGTMILAAGLAWWYRRNDRRVRAVLAAARPVPMLDSEESQV